MFHHLKILVLCILLLVFAASPACRPRFTAPAEVDVVFYEDQMDIAGLVTDSDGPERRASMRILQKSWEEERVMGNPRFFEQMEKALAIDAQNPFLFYFMAKKSLKEKKWEKAKLYAQKAQALFGGEVRWQAKALLIGFEAQTALGKMTDAQVLWQRAQKLDPEHPMFHGEPMEPR